MKKKVLFVVRKANRCGVADYARRLHPILQKSEVIETHKIEIESVEEFIDEYNKANPDLILYNYYTGLLHFLHDDFLKCFRNVPNVVLYHESEIGFTQDAIINTNCTIEDDLDKLVFSLPRPLFENVNFKEFPPNEVTTIGSFGFGFADKSWDLAAKVVCEQFDQAKIRIHVPFATFGDEVGEAAKKRVDEIKEVIHNLGTSKGKNIQLEVNHDFLSHQDLLNFLRQNDLNLFIYGEMASRGLSSTTDYALSVKKPIAIGNSNMFKHMDFLKPFISAYERPLKDIIADGIELLKPVYEKYSNKALLEKYEYAISTILNKKLI